MGRLIGGGGGDGRLAGLRPVLRKSLPVCVDLVPVFGVDEFAGQEGEVDSPAGLHPVIGLAVVPLKDDVVNLGYIDGCSSRLSSTSWHTSWASGTEFKME